MYANLPSLLRQTQFFERFSDEEKKALLGMPHFFSNFRAGEFLIRENENDDNALFVILQGSASVTKNSNPKQLLDTMVAGNVFGEISFLIQIPRTSNVIALEDSICFVLKSNKLDKLPLQLQLKFRDCLIDILVKRLIHLDHLYTSQAVLEGDIKE
jgi:CRP-like cAMP-binding protein